VSARVPARVSITRTTFSSDPTGWQRVVIPAGGFFRQDGRAVQTFAIRKAGAVLDTLRADLDPASAGRLGFIGHQANLLMLEAVVRRGGIAPERHFYNVDRFGNCGAASAPGVLSQRWDGLAAGELIALAVVGSGLAWGGALIEVTA
jgi:3-oxoacyl-[acyl-carrier-protein] synthase-3